jgi:HEAT repeat protein
LATWVDWQNLFDNDRSEETRLHALLGVQQYTLTPYGRDLLVTLLADEHQPDRIRSAVVMVVGNSLSPYHPLTDWQWLRPYLTEAHTPLMRRCAIQTLIDSQNPDLIAWLLPCLQHQDKNVFADAAQALGQFGYAALPYLGQLLADDTLPPDAQCVAAWQLGELKSFSALPMLIPVVSNPDRHTDVRALAVWALGQIGQASPEVLLALTACQQEAEPDIRLRAETALKKIRRNSN